jgi:hypothetical protein
MAVISFDSFDPFDQSDSINSLIGQYKEVRMSWMTTNLYDFRIVLLNLLNTLIWIYLFTVQHSILITAYQHVLIPHNTCVINFSRVINLKQQLIREWLKDVNILVEWCRNYKMLLGHVNGVWYCQPMIVVIGAINLKCCSWLSKNLFVWVSRKLYLLYDVQVTGRVAHV